MDDSKTTPREVIMRVISTCRTDLVLNGYASLCAAIEKALDAAGFMAPGQTTGSLAAPPGTPLSAAGTRLSADRTEAVAPAGYIRQLEKSVEDARAFLAITASRAREAQRQWDEAIEREMAAVRRLLEATNHG